MVIEIDFYTAVFLRNLIEPRLAKLKKDYNHYLERKQFISIEVYHSKMSMLTYEIENMERVYDKLTNIIAMIGITDGVFREIGMCSKCLHCNDGGNDVLD